MIDFSNVARLHIPEGEVKRVLNESGIVIWKKGAPSYVELEYLVFDDDIVFDTGLHGNINTIIETKWQRSNDTTSMYLYGCASTGNAASITAYSSGSGGWRFGNRNLTINSLSTQIHISIHNKERVYRDDSYFNYGTIASEFTTPYTILVGSAHNASGKIDGGAFMGKIYYFKMWDGDNLVLDWIPVKKGNENGFLDRVSNKFIRPIVM